MIREIAFIVLFVLCLSLPGLGMVFATLEETPQGDALQLTENRTKASMPESSLLRHRPKKFFKQFSNYFSDRVGFRDQMLLAHTQLYQSLFKETGVGKVLLGTQDWLFYNDQDVRASYQIPDAAWEQKIKVWEKILKRKTEFVANFDAEYHLLIAPNKHSVYPEYLPNALFKRAAPTKRELLVKSLRDASYPLTDFTNALEQAKDKRQVYFKTDTHWNDFGAMTAVRLALKNAKRSPEQHAPTEFSSKEFRGDLALIWGREDSIEVAAFRVSMPACASNSTSEEFVFTKKRLSVEHFSCAQNEERVLLFADSFGVAFKRQLAPLVGSLYVAEQRPSYYEFNFLVQELNPTLVLELVAERLLAHTPAKGRPLGTRKQSKL